MPESLIQIDLTAVNRLRLPACARKPQRRFQALHHLKTELRAMRLHTVCESARCQNIHECFHRGAATFMILGNLCTPGFCAVPKGSPEKHELPLDPDEPANIARMAGSMKLRHLVVLVRSSYMAEMVSEQAAC